MSNPDVTVDLPDGWKRLGADDRLVLSPDGGASALSLSIPTWQVRRDQDLKELVPRLQLSVKRDLEGRAPAVEPYELSYGRALRAEVTSEHYAHAVVWLVVPAVHDPLWITWLANADLGAVVADIVASLRPGLFSAAISSAAEIGGRALAIGTLFPHAVMFGGGDVSQVDLRAVPQAMWNDACRHERAQHNASVVVLVLPGEDHHGKSVAMIYAESLTRQRRLVIGDGPQPIDLPLDKRIDFFSPADPEVARTLDAVRRPRE